MSKCEQIFENENQKYQLCISYKSINYLFDSLHTKQVNSRLR